jgi:hypothetical protein
VAENPWLDELEGNLDKVDDIGFIRVAGLAMKAAKLPTRVILLATGAILDSGLGHLN